MAFLPRLWARHPAVAVIRLAGIIGPPAPFRRGLSLEALAAPLERAFSLRNLQTVAIAINSPGGSPVQSALIAKRLRDLAVEKKVPVVAFAEDIAASGGYWLACAADEIWAHESSILGSIGVVSAGFGFSDLMQKIGIERRLHVSGERKGMLDPFRPESEEDVARLKALQHDIHANFIQHVRERRGAKLKADDATLFNGDIWTGRRAVELGLIDGIGEMRSIMRARYGEKVRFRTISSGGGWLRRRLRFTSAPEHWAYALIAAAEERALWARYGL